MSRYFLSRHSFACEAAGHAVFLDLKRDKYTAVAPEDLHVLRTAVWGWPTAPGAGEEPRVSSEVPLIRSAQRMMSAADLEVMEALIAKGLVTVNANHGKEVTPPHIHTPTDTYWTNQRLWPQLTAQHLWNFISAWMITTAMLRTLPIRVIVSRARRRKQRETPSAAEIDVHKVRMLCNIHFVLQPAFYSAKDACLRNSLTLIEFLAKYRIYPTWAFGVRMEPFAAHSWVQHGPVLCTDPIEHVKTFTPIMVV